MPGLCYTLSLSLSVSLFVILSLCFSLSLSICLSLYIYIYIYTTKRERERERERERDRDRDRDRERQTDTHTDRQRQRQIYIVVECFHLLFGDLTIWWCVCVSFAALFCFFLHRRRTPVSVGLLITWCRREQTATTSLHQGLWRWRLDETCPRRARSQEHAVWSQHKSTMARRAAETETILLYHDGWWYGWHSITLCRRSTWYETMWQGRGPRLLSQ